MLIHRRVRDYGQDAVNHQTLCTCMSRRSKSESTYHDVEVDVEYTTLLRPKELILYLL